MIIVRHVLDTESNVIQFVPRIVYKPHTQNVLDQFFDDCFT